MLRFPPKNRQPLAPLASRLAMGSTTSTERQDFIKIIKCIWVGIDSKGSGVHPNVVQWDVDKNASMKSGLLSHICMVVLLEWNNNSHFTA